MKIVAQDIQQHRAIKDRVSELPDVIKSKIETADIWYSDLMLTLGRVSAETTITVPSDIVAITPQNEYLLLIYKEYIFKVPFNNGIPHARFQFYP